MVYLVASVDWFVIDANMWLAWHDQLSLMPPFLVVDKLDDVEDLSIGTHNYGGVLDLGVHIWGIYSCDDEDMVKIVPLMVFSWM